MRHPRSLQAERPSFLHISEDISSGPQEHLAFSLVAHAASELFLIERWCLTVIYLVPPWFLVVKKKDLISQGLSSGLCPQGQHRNQIVTNNMTDTATSQALERVTGVLVSWAPPSGKGLSALVLASVSLQMGFKSNALSGLGLEINLSILCWKAWLSLSPETLRICKGPIFRILSQQPGDGERGGRHHPFHAPCALTLLLPDLALRWSPAADHSTSINRIKRRGRPYLGCSEGLFPGKTQRRKEGDSFLLRGWACYWFRCQGDRCYHQDGSCLLDTLL